jgi:hypothetical protein
VDEADSSLSRGAPCGQVADVELLQTMLLLVLKRGGADTKPAPATLIVKPPKMEPVVGLAELTLIE